jgi:hypothetical protein
MYCRNCGKETTSVSEYCMSCGARPSAGTAFCPACAGPTTPLSEICVKCGTRLISSTTVVPSSRNRKSKTASILLAVFLSYWTWLYTYKKDAWKFWVGLGINTVFGVGFFVVLISMLVRSTRNQGYGGQLEGSFFVLFFVSYLCLWIIVTGIWVWGIVDTAIKKNDWYDNYPDVK